MEFVFEVLMATTTNGETKLIVAPSDIDADMLYATKFWAGDPFIFLQQNGKRTIVLSDLEMGRGRNEREGRRICFV